MCVIVFESNLKSVGKSDYGRPCKTTSKPSEVSLNIIFTMRARHSWISHSFGQLVAGWCFAYFALSLTTRLSTSDIIGMWLALCYSCKWGCNPTTLALVLCIPYMASCTTAMGYIQHADMGVHLCVVVCILNSVCCKKGLHAVYVVA